MSESRPSSSPTEDGQASSGRRRARRRDRGPWFIVSMGLHGVAIIALVYLTPIREIVRDVVRQQKPETTISAAGLTELADALEVRAADQITRNARELDNVLGEMFKIQERMTGDYSTFEQQQREDAARDAIEEMEKAVEHMENAVELVEADTDVEATDRQQAQAEQAQERARRKLEMVLFDVADPLAEHQAAESAHQAAKAFHDQHSDRKQVIPARERALQTEQQRAEDLRTRIADMREQERPAEQIQQEEQRLTEQEQRVTTAAEQLAALEQERDELLVSAAEQQKQAIELQKQALGILQATVEARAEAASGSGGPGADDGSPLPDRRFARPPVPYDSSRGRQTDVPELYQQARTMEDMIAESFKEIRAMDLAMVRDVKLEDARSDIDLVRPVRPDLNDALLEEDVRTDDVFEEHKEELKVALRETNSMVDLGHRMLEMANQSVDRMKFGTDAGGMELPEAPDFALIIRELAMEDVSGRFSDMAMMMQAMEDGELMEGQARRRQSGADMEGEEDMAELLQGAPMLFGAGEEAGGPIPELDRDIPAVGARKMGGGGQPGEWMFIDSWWTLGPFPNPNRINIDREFPPDSLIDLDATYVGKDGRTIKWQFVQSEKPEIVPHNAEPYGIWYAYTEFYCDRPRDVLIAMGTDDRGNLKINGVPVWISSKRLKGWDIDEVWRRVHFNEGINRILYRVENGWMHIGFSLVMRLED
jgi:hypothetical protein